MMDAAPDASTSVPTPTPVSPPEVSASRRTRRRVYVLGGVAIAVVVVAVAAAVWVLWLYDPGPSLSMDQVEGVQVAVDGWQDVDLAGPATEEIDAFVSAAASSRALWPPDLMFP